ncbi:UNKNOWN [Stylonychia lemnae]|uniref:Uncharacterized protein n=1 Tax=Stylonychia lemnae TaxID=5949 RepID=A0A077ZSP0_STYLE|nr:UNKNOWN [Stylonychia lemnae]|eukprot:CDW72325.1 UNKNOWN [Stylonychia lemnae]
MESIQRKKCCQLVSHIAGKQYLLPLKSQTIFYNNFDDLLEVTLDVPINEDYGIGKLIVQIGDEIIEGKILEQYKAQEKYEDAVAQGHTAIMASEDEQKDEIIKLTIGNLLPGQEATVHLQLLNVLKIEGAAYCLRVPLYYFPKYSSGLSQYSYKFQVEILSDSPVTYLGYPKDSKMFQTISDKNLLQIQIEKTQDNVFCLENDLIVYYRNNDMESTVLYSQESDRHPNQVAIMLSVVPSFIESTIESSPSLEIFEDDIPNSLDVEYENSDDCMFIFLVDRSGSMSGEKMRTTIEALKLFLKSLPSSSSFEIISFGYKYSVLSGQKNGFNYCDETMNLAISKINHFEADMGGTDIYQPLDYAIHDIQTKLQKRIFLLTDGEVNNRKSVIRLAKQCSFDTRIHTIGIGRDCDASLVKKVAKQGRGSCSLVLDNTDLSAIVILALGRAKDPSYSNCKFTLSPNPIITTNNMKHKFSGSVGYELFRNEIFLLLSIIPKSEFSQLKLKASSDIHPVSNKGINHVWSSDDFKQLDKGEELFKIAARMRINELSTPALRYQDVPEQDIKEISLEYQVLSKYTSFLAISKNDEKPIGQLRQVQLGQSNYLEQIENQSQNLKLPYSYSHSTSQESIFEKIGYAVVSFFGLIQTSSAPFPNEMAISSSQNYTKRSEQALKQFEDVNQPLQKEEVSCYPLKTFQQKGKREIVQKVPAPIGDQDDNSENEETQYDRISQQTKVSCKKQSTQIKLTCKQEEDKQIQNNHHESNKINSVSQRFIDPLQLQKHTNMSQKMPLGKISQTEMIQKNKPPQNLKLNIKSPLIDRQSKTYNDLIMDQSSQGYWQSAQVIQSFIEEDIFSDQDLIKEIKQLLNDQVAFDSIWITLLALYILQKKFNSKKNEWKLVAQKGNFYIRLYGIKKPDNFIKKINYQAI